MILRFHPLFTVAPQHSYYVNRCDDFEFVVPATTARALQGSRLQIRVLQGRLRAIYAADSAGTPLHPGSDQRLLFGLKLRNRFFSNFTNPVLSVPGQIPLYANTDNPLTLASPIGVVLTSGFYEHRPQIPTRPLKLQLSNARGDPVATQQLSPGAHSCPFDLRGVSEGSYRLTEDDGNGEVRELQLIVSPELHRAGLWGLLAIQVAAAHYDTPAAFTLNFSARHEWLKYYVVANRFSQPEFDQLQVTDTGFAEQGRTQLNFTRVPPTAFSTSDPEPALLSADHDRVVLFQSTDVVARREHGLRKIQLHRNGDILVAHLPQPTAASQQAQFIVHLSKP